MLQLQEIKLGFCGKFQIMNVRHVHYTAVIHDF